MEKAVISYGKGLTTSPSDLICSDGELAECVNLEVKNEELVPMEMPTRLGVSLESGERLVLVHKTKTSDKHYFTLNNGVLRCFSISGSNKDYKSLSVECGEVKSIQALGNTVVVYTENSPHYIVYKDNDYKYLGSKLPEIGLSFSLEGDPVVSEIFDVDVPAKDDGDGDTADNPDLSSDENKESATKQIIPNVNKFIAEESEEKGLFIFPFFVRYAYRLYDGSYVMQSSPCLMMPSTTMAPICGFIARQIKRPPFKTFVGAIPSMLSVRNYDWRTKIADWSDIISSVVIFVSSPIRTYDQNGSVDSFSYTTKQSASIKSTFYGSLKTKSANKKYNLDEEISGENYDGQNPISSHNIWDLPQKEGVMAEVSACSLFYRYASYTPEEIDKQSYWVISPAETGINPVSGIELSEVLPDDYMTHDVLVPESSFVYNSRLNISNIKRILFNGYPATSLSQVGTNGNNNGLYDVYTYIKTQNGTSIVKSPTSITGSDMYGTYLFYPDSDAYQMVIHDVQLGRYATVPLVEHTGLNGAYYFGDFNELSFISGDPNVEETEQNYEIMGNKLFVSSVNNPFHFPLEGIYTVGTDRIIGMGAITRPISQGQFGEFPLIVFCSDGNYAMRVDEQGFYASISPVQEDLVLGSDKITSMENSLVVITKKGIMLTAGGEMNKVASQMDGAMIMASSLSGIGTSVSDLSNLVSKSSDDMGFLSYVYGSRMAFDYASNRLLVYNPEKTYSYVYDFNNDTVSKLVINGGRKIVASVLDYPDTIIQDDSGAMYSLYTKDDISTKTGRQYGFALTRPLKMGAALNLKSVKQVMHLTSNCGNGSFVKYILYGSNDNATYYRVSSRFGKPYKYYRIAIYTHLLPKESLSGSAITTEERRTHKLR